MRTNYEDRLLRVLAYIHDNPAGDLCLDTLADVAAMSRFHWHRVFRAMTGETCADAVRRIRMNRAACWLVQTDWPVRDVARKCGYPSIHSFSRTFRDTYGLPPGLFREQGDLVSPHKPSRKGPYPMHNITVETRPALTLAALEHRGPYLEIGSKFEQVATIATTRNLWSSTRGMAGVYLDDPSSVEAKDLRSFAGLVLADGTDAPDGLLRIETHSGSTAVLTYKGPYAGLPAAYDYIYCDWLPKSGRDIADAPCYEVYLNAPADTAPEELLTEICVPLA